MLQDSASTVENLLQVKLDARDTVWEIQFLKALPAQKMRVLDPQPKHGPDGWPYLFANLENSVEADSVGNICKWLSTRGIGLAVNPEGRDIPDYVLTYGMIWNFRERGEFLTTSDDSLKPSLVSPRPQELRIKNGQQVYTGAPSESFLPRYVRHVLKEFFMDQGILTVKAVMLSQDGVQFDLCFSLESLRNPPAKEHAGIAEAISWFLPAHYSVALLSETVVPGFVLL